MDKYQLKGYKNRDEYLEFLSCIYDISIETIFALAKTMGENEDFNELVNLLEEINEKIGVNVV